jgi:ribonuclease HII
MYESHIRGNEELVFKTASVDNNTIDEINILQATFKAMSESVLSVIEEVKGRNPKASFSILIDGNKVPPQIITMQGRGDIQHAQCVIKGDSIEFVIAAASICAKVERDLMMRKIDIEFPFYGFSQHKGYPTASHVAAISRQGPCKYHRMTFRPLKNNISIKKSRKSQETKASIIPSSGRDERMSRRNQRREQYV